MSSRYRANNVAKELYALEASEWLGDNGVLALIANGSFIESRIFDGLRKVVTQEFSEIYIVDFSGEVRTYPKLSGTKHNVFGIQTAWPSAAW